MSQSFTALGASAPVVETLARLGIRSPFAIQALVLPDALAGIDVLAASPTGSGKTLAFGIPMIERTAGASAHPGALVLVPTRELASQIVDELQPLAEARNLRVAAVYGGTSVIGQAKRARGADVLVATPGRLFDLLERRLVSLASVRVLVLDEADRMLDMGFKHAVEKIVGRTPRKRQTLLFSATLDGAVAVLTRDYQHTAVRHDIGEPESDGRSAHHMFWQVEGPNRSGVAAGLVPVAGPTIMFCRTRRGADRLAAQLARNGVRTEAIHGGRSQNQRDRAHANFKAGKVDALVATDVAARGIHVDDVACVVHFDTPEDEKAYLHRSGRTARAGAAGVVVSFVPHADRRSVARMQRVLDIPGKLTRPDLDGLAELIA